MSFTWLKHSAQRFQKLWNEQHASSPSYCANNTSQLATEAIFFDRRHTFSPPHRICNCRTVIRSRSPLCFVVSEKSYSVSLIPNNGDSYVILLEHATKFFFHSLGLISRTNLSPGNRKNTIPHDKSPFLLLWELKFINVIFKILFLAHNKYNHFPLHKSIYECCVEKKLYLLFREQ